jgi:hypothetical protein
MMSHPHSSPGASLPHEDAQASPEFVRQEA